MTYINEQYDPINNNCFDYIKKIYPKLDFDVKFKNVKQALKDKDKIIDEIQDDIIEVFSPIENCIVLMNDHHVGIYKDNKVYHFDKDGFQIEPIHKIRYKYNKIRFFRIKENNEKDSIKDA